MDSIIVLLQALLKWINVHNNDHIVLTFTVLGASPVFTTPSGGTDTLSIDEDIAVGTSIYSVAATDADGDSLTYSVTGAEAAFFTIDTQTVKTSTTFDYESTTSYTVTIS